MLEALLQRQWLLIRPNKQIIGKMSMHTTHSSAEGVSEGIVNALSSLIERNNINPDGNRTNFTQYHSSS